MKNLGKCQVVGCNEPAKYDLNRTMPNGSKVWLHVCEYHEKIIGDENISRAGGRYKEKKGVVRSGTRES